MEAHVAQFRQTLTNVETELAKQINYLTQVSTGVCVLICFPLFFFFVFTVLLSVLPASFFLSSSTHFSLYILNVWIFFRTLSFPTNSFHSIIKFHSLYPLPQARHMRDQVTTPRRPYRWLCIASTTPRPEWMNWTPSRTNTYRFYSNTNYRSNKACSNLLSLYNRKGGCSYEVFL